MNHNYGKHGDVKANRVNVHEHLGMTLHFTENKTWELILMTMLKGLSISSQVREMRI